MNEQGNSVGKFVIADRAFEYFSNNVTFREAKINCGNDENAHLAYAKTSNDEKCIMDKIPSMNTWIGVQHDSGRIFRWLDGETYETKNSPSELCGKFLITETRQQIAFDNCSKKLPYLCERQFSLSTTEITTTDLGNIQENPNNSFMIAGVVAGLLLLIALVLLLLWLKRRKQQNQHGNTTTVSHVYDVVAHDVREHPPVSAAETEYSTVCNDNRFVPSYNQQLTNETNQQSTSTDREQGSDVTGNCEYAVVNKQKKSAAKSTDVYAVVNKGKKGGPGTVEAPRGSFSEDSGDG